MKKAVAASGWNQVSEKKKAKIRAQAAALAKRISEGAAPGRHLPYPLFQRVMFLGIKAMMRKNNRNPLDKGHWEAQGRLSGAKPF